MFLERAVQLLSCKRVRDCQNGGSLDLRGHWHWDSQGYRKRWDGAYSGGGLVCPRGTIHLISIRVLDEEGCQIQVQKGVVTVSQRNKVIEEREKCGGLYKLKEGSSVRGRVSRISLEGSSSRGGASRKTVTGREPGQSLREEERVHSGKTRDDSSHGSKSAKGHEKRGQELKVSRHGYN